MFADDPFFKAKHSGKTASQISTDVVKRKRKDNINHGTIYGLVKEREDAMVHNKMINTYIKAGVK